MQKLVLGLIFLLGLSLSSAFSDCGKRGLHGPTHGSKGNVFVYHRNDGNGIVTYLFENRNDFPADIAFAVGDLRDGRFIERGGCAEVLFSGSIQKDEAQIIRDLCQRPAFTPQDDYPELFPDLTDLPVTALSALRGTPFLSVSRQKVSAANPHPV